jgi:hypothetical protein
VVLREHSVCTSSKTIFGYLLSMIRERKENVNAATSVSLLSRAVPMEKTVSVSVLLLVHARPKKAPAGKKNP